METYPPNADSLMAILRRLRAPDGCPWDRKQTRASLARHLDGECAELIDAIDRDDVPNIREELGDVLMNLLFQVVVAEEKGEFDLASVWREIIEKMIRRHAHIFGSEHAATAEEVVGLWEKIKREERGGENAPPESVMDDVKLCLSSLERAEKLQKKAAECGFDWPDAVGVTDKIGEELGEVREALAAGDEAHTDEELGDLLFSVVNLIRFRRRGTSGELLRCANRKFERRFRAMERMLAAGGTSCDACSPEQLEAAWRRVKDAEKPDADVKNDR